MLLVRLVGPGGHLLKPGLSPQAVQSSSFTIQALVAIYCSRPLSSVESSEHLVWWPSTSSGGLEPLLSLCLVAICWNLASFLCKNWSCLASLCACLVPDTPPTQLFSVSAALFTLSRLPLLQSASIHLDMHITVCTSHKIMK